MTYTAKITLKFDSTWDFKGGIYDDEILPEQHITMEVPAEDLNSIQLFKLWENFLQAMGHNEVGIMKGACYVAFNDMRSDENMRKIADEFDIKMMEDHYEIVAELQEEIIKLKSNNWEEQFNNLYKRFKKFARFTDDQLEEMVADAMPPWGHSDMEALKYTDVEMDAMCNYAKKKEQYNEWDNLVPGSDAAYAKGCKCPILDNQEMPNDRKWVNGDCPLHGKAK